MRVYLERIGDIAPWHDQHLRMREFATQDQVRRHRLTDDADSADLLLSVVNGDIRYHECTFDRRRRVFCSYDVGFPQLPGLYPSLPRWNTDARYAWSAPYLPKRWDLDPICSGLRPVYLFSFVGSSLTSLLRRRILALEHSSALLRDSSNDDAYKSNQPRDVYHEFEESYRRTLAESLFVLCPRGVGVSSIRLFETMRAGRVPVIISDDWVPPKGPKWNDFAVRVPEHDIETIPKRLEALKERASEMGAIAKRCWEANFSEKTIFDWIVEQAALLQPGSEQHFHRWRGFQKCHPKNLRTVLLPQIKRTARGIFTSREPITS